MKTYYTHIVDFIYCCRVELRPQGGGWPVNLGFVHLPYGSERLEAVAELAAAWAKRRGGQVRLTLTAEVPS